MINKLRRKKEKIMWIIEDYYMKNEHNITPKINIIVSIVCIITYIIIYFYLLSKLEVITIDFKNMKFITLLEVDFNCTIQELVISQIGSTFLTTAVLSLISSMEDKYILGEKKTSLLFGKKLLKFYIPMFLLYFLMIINIVFIIKEKNSNLIISFFLLSILILIYIINKIGSMFVTTKKYTKKLYSKYYNECHRNIINNVPPRDYNSPLLVNLREETIKLISNNDINYVKNISMYKCLIDRLLFNVPKELQKYHLDMIDAPSIINDFIEIIYHFIIFKDLTRAIQYYDWLLSKLNYHNVYISYEDMNEIFKELTNKITDLSSEFEVTRYIDELAHLITSIETQQHFALTNDFSYISIPNARLYYIHHYKCNYFEIVYDKVFTNKKLSEREKINCYTKLFEVFRMSAYYGCSMIRDITNYSYDYKKGKPRNMPSCIIGQATALLLLKCLNNKDERNFKLFLGMNNKPEEIRCAIHLVLLTLINMEKYKLDNNIYNEFYKIDLKFAKNYLKNNKTLIFNNKEDVWIVKECIKYIQQDYDYIIKRFINNESKEKSFIDYNFKYSEDLINQYFYKLAKEFNISIKIKEKKKSNYRKIINNYFE